MKSLFRFLCVHIYIYRERERVLLGHLYIMYCNILPIHVTISVSID